MEIFITNNEIRKERIERTMSNENRILQRGGRKSTGKKRKVLWLSIMVFRGDRKFFVAFVTQLLKS